MMRSVDVRFSLSEGFTPLLRAPQLGPPNPPDKLKSVEVEVVVRIILMIIESAQWLLYDNNHSLTMYPKLL